MAPVALLTPGDGQGEDEMDQVPSGVGEVTVPRNLDQQNLARIASAGASAHEHFITYGKILDLAYEADRKMVSLVESLGVRESTSKSGQIGVPLAGAGAAA
jgi:hypothetical protein